MIGDIKMYMRPLDKHPELTPQKSHNTTSMILDLRCAYASTLTDRFLITRRRNLLPFHLLPLTTHTPTPTPTTLPLLLLNLPPSPPSTPRRRCSTRRRRRRRRRRLSLEHSFPSLLLLAVLLDLDGAHADGHDEEGRHGASVARRVTQLLVLGVRVWLHGVGLAAVAGFADGGVAVLEELLDGVIGSACAAASVPSSCCSELR